MWNDKYTMLKEGEIIRAGDEYDACVDGWRDPVDWQPIPTHMIGRPASDPNYPAHTIYRRLKAIGESEDE